MPTEQPAPSYRALIRVPVLGRVLLGMTIARTASAMLTIALVPFALDRYHSPAIAGLVAFAGTFPGVVVSPIAGALLDRHGRTRLVRLDYFIAAGACWLIAALASADVLPAELLVLLVALTSLTNPLSLSGLRSLLPLLVPPALWGRVNAVDSNAYVVATLIGPPVAGALVAVAGGPAAIAAVGVVFAVAAFVVLRVPDPEVDVLSSGRLLVDAWAGLRYVLRHPTLRSLALSIAALNMGFGMLQIVVPVLLLQSLGEGPATVGVAWAVLGLTGLVAAFVFGRYDSRGREKGMIVWPLLGTSVAMMLLLLPPSVAVIVAALALFGFLNGPLDIGLFTIRQRRTDPAWMGRAFAISMAINGAGIPLGSGVAGLLVEHSIPAAVVFGIAACLIGGIAGLAFLPAAAAEAAAEAAA